MLESESIMRSRGTGPALVLQHGFTSCLEDWYECGYVAALQPKYRLILVDARGHGDSDKPHDEASYTLDRRVADVTAVLDAATIEKARFWGYSTGGWIGFGMAKFAPRRVNALVIGGQHPFARDQSGFREWVREGITGGVDPLVAAFERMAGPISDSYAARLRAADLEAYLAAAHTDCPRPSTTSYNRSRRPLGACLCCDTRCHRPPIP
jgi:pimeloyl-ACP methyl ester carboxylesterase